MKTKTNRSIRLLALTGAAALATLLAAPGVSRAQNLYVTNVGDNTIRVLTPSGTSTTFASGGTLNYSEDLAFDSSGNLFASNGAGNTITKITPAGVQSTFSSGSSFSNPQGIAFDATGNLYVANNSGNNILKITPGGAISTFATGGSLSGPSEITFDTAGNLYVANGGGNTIERFTSGGVGTIFASGGMLNLPSALEFTADGTLLVVNNNSTTVEQFTTAGVGTLFGTVPSGNDYGIAISQAGNVFVPAGFSNSIYEFGPGGGSPTTFATGLNGPIGLAFQVPEPSTWATVAAGAGLLGLTLRRRRVRP